MKTYCAALILLAQATLTSMAQTAAVSPMSGPGTGYFATAANGTGIPQPTSIRTYPVTDGTRTVQVPENMVYVPAGKSLVGDGPGATTTMTDGYCIGRFSVTNAEYKAFLDATHARAPQYWTNGNFPAGKENHPVVYVSLLEASAYAAWVSAKTGWNVSIPTSSQWEKAARGPQGFLYPWGNTQDTAYHGGVLTIKFNYNAVTAAWYLKNQPKFPVTYNNPKSSYVGTKTTVDRIAAFDPSGAPSYLEISPNGAVKGWVNHMTYTGFIYTDLFTSLNAAGGNTTPVGTYEAGKSACGCYDMAGNVWNWCATNIVSTNGAERGRTVNEIRGGSWYANGNSCRSVGVGEGRPANLAYNTVGFRLVMLPVVN